MTTELWNELTAPRRPGESRLSYRARRDAARDIAADPDAAASGMALAAA